MPIVSELFFAIFIAVGFLHNIGFAALGVFLGVHGWSWFCNRIHPRSGWQTEYYLWYVNPAVLMLALPMRYLRQMDWRGCVHWCLLFTYLEFSSNSPAIELPMFTTNLLGISNIVGSLLLQGLPMGLYSTALTVKEMENPSFAPQYHAKTNC